MESSDESLSIVSSGDEEREQILRPCHPHPLELIRYGSDPVWRTCDICELTLPHEQVWGCVEEECDFHIHDQCLQCLPEVVQLTYDSDYEVLVLSLHPLNEDDDKQCLSCSNKCAGASYRPENDSVNDMCIMCCLLMKQTNDQVPKSINHFFDPCELELKLSPSTTCNACFLNHHVLSYHCELCHFYLDFECAQLPQVSFTDDSNQIHHFCHWHPLQLLPDEAIDGETLCKLCESSSSKTRKTFDSFFGCTQCQFYVHKSCMNILPQRTIHPSLYETVVLLTTPSYVCTTYDRACSGLAFRFMKLYFEGNNFCVKCILWPKNEFAGDGGFESIHHWHELTIRQVDKASCFMCKKDCSSWSYECNKCSIYFHKSCAELPQERRLPIHPHPLTLTALDTSKSIRCNLCIRFLEYCSLHNWYYHCESCSFSLDSYCVSLSFIQYQGHPHLLGVVPDFLEDGERCDKCSATLPLHSSVLTCVKCCFYLHLECGPLPCKIKDHHHVHPLTLREYYVKDNMSDEFACHICEEKRDPRLPVYLCTEGCLMTCDVKCVLREVLPSLGGERGVIDLDTVYPKVASKMITTGEWSLNEITKENVAAFSLKELVESAKPDSESDEPLEEVNNKLSSGVSDLRKDDDSSQSEYGGSKYPYTRKAFVHFIKKLEGNQGMDFNWDEFEDIFSELEGSSVGGDYLLPDILDSVYHNFFAKHTIFGPECKLNHDRKRLIVFYVCSVLHDMRMTKVVDVSARRIASWSSALKAVRSMYRHNGLNLDFLFRHVMRIAEDHYLVKAVDIIEKTFSKLCNKKEELSTRKERLIRELAETETEIEDNKEELLTFRTYRYIGANELKKEYFASLENKWRPCYEC